MQSKKAPPLSPLHPADLFPWASTDPPLACREPPHHYLGLKLIFRAARGQTKGAGGGHSAPSLHTSQPLPHLNSPLGEATE